MQARVSPNPNHSPNPSPSPSPNPSPNPNPNQRIELTGSVEEILALRAAEEKEKRVEQLAQRAMKRLSNQGIMRGFSAWQDGYLTAAKQKRMLAAAGARIMRPGLAMAVSHWKGDWEADRRTSLALQVQRRERARFGTVEQEVAAVRAKAEADQASAKERERAALEKQVRPNPNPNQY